MQIGHDNQTNELSVIREVERCARLACQIKVEDRLQKLSGFFEKLKKRKQILQWGLELEHDYESTVKSTPGLWDTSLGSDGRTLSNLWSIFGLGDAHSSEAIYDDAAAVRCISAWTACLYPNARIASSDLSDEVLRLGIRNSQELEAGYERGVRIRMPLPIDQVIHTLSEQLGPYGEKDLCL